MTNSLPSDVSVTPIPAFTDNYIWAFYNQNDCVVVDPGDAQPVLTFCEQHKLSLVSVLITHHHPDHTGGLKALIDAFPDIVIYGPQSSRIPLINQHVEEGDAVRIAALNLAFNVIELPGHTLDHIAYEGHGGVLCGDTLFSAGCGRLFEGTPTQMLASLDKLKALPDSTLVWCTHEYTLANLAFAKAVEPDNHELNEYSAWADAQRANGKPTLPSDIGTQKAINPFLRVGETSVRRGVENNDNQNYTTELDTFAAVRRWKDNF